MRVTVKTRGVQRQRTFPIGTSAQTIKDWKERERLRIRQERGPASKGTLAFDIDDFLDSLADRPKLKKERTYQLEWWNTRFGRLRRSDITSMMIRKALAELRREREASTCNHYRDALAALYTAIDGKDARNPLRNVPKFTEPEAEPRNLPRTLIALVLDTMPNYTGPVKGKKRGSVSLGKLRLRVMWNVGLSPAEIMRLRPGDLFLNDSAVYVQRRQKGKGVEGITLPLTPGGHGVAALRDFAAAGAFGRFSTHSLRKSFRLACQKLLDRDAEKPDDEKDLTDIGRRLLKRARPYDLRHTFGTYIFRETGDLNTTKELMRHRSTKTTMRYMRGAVQEHLRQAVERLAGQPMAKKEVADSGLAGDSVQSDQPAKTA